MLEVDMKNGHINPSDTDWAKSFNEGLGKSKTSSEFKTKCIYLIVNYNELRCKGLPHHVAVKELKNELLQARVNFLCEAKIQQLQEHTQQMPVLSGKSKTDESEFFETESDSDETGSPRAKQAAQKSPERVGLQL